MLQSLCCSTMITIFSIFFSYWLQMSDMRGMSSCSVCVMLCDTTFLGWRTDLGTRWRSRSRQLLRLQSMTKDRKRHRRKWECYSLPLWWTERKVQQEMTLELAIRNLHQTVTWLKSLRKNYQWIFQGTRHKVKRPRLSTVQEIASKLLKRQPQNVRASIWHPQIKPHLPPIFTMMKYGRALMPQCKTPAI